MMDNDSVGDCTCACAGHMVQTWTANCGNQVIIPDAAILSAYEAVSGYRPGQPSTDVGATCEDVLAYWKNTGIGGHVIVGYASVDLTDKSEVEDSVYLFGGTYLGINMPISAQDQTGPGLVWDVPPGGPRGNVRSGELGRSCRARRGLRRLGAHGHHLGLAAANDLGVPRYLLRRGLCGPEP